MPELNPDPPAPEPTRLRVFIDNPDGEGPFHCGEWDNKAELFTAIGRFIEGDLDATIGEGEMELTIIFTAKMMTDQEVAALPEW